jgi:hypothetical protein
MTTRNYAIATLLVALCSAYSSPSVSKSNRAFQAFLCYDPLSPPPHNKLADDTPCGDGMYCRSGSCCSPTDPRKKCQPPPPFAR